jgi:pyruvate/oxaloacetate carboxyltransferase
MFKIYVELKNVVEGKYYKVRIKKDDNQYDKEESVSASNPSTVFYDVPGGAYTASATDEKWAAHETTFQAFQDGQTVHIYM